MVLHVVSLAFPLPLEEASLTHLSGERRMLICAVLSEERHAGVVAPLNDGLLLEFGGLLGISLELAPLANLT